MTTKTDNGNQLMTVLENISARLEALEAKPQAATRSVAKQAPKAAPKRTRLPNNSTISITMPDGAVCELEVRYQKFRKSEGWVVVPSNGNFAEDNGYWFRAFAFGESTK